MTARARRALIVIGASLGVLLVASVLYLRPTILLPVGSRPAEPARQTQLPALRVLGTLWQSADRGWVVLGAVPEISILYGTTDGGRHWARLSTVHGYLEPSEVVGRSMFSARVSFSRGTSRTFLRSDDGGRHWRDMTMPATYESFSVPRFVDPEHGWVLAAPAANSQAVLVFQTEDRGTHWTPVASLDLAGFEFGVGASDLTFTSRQVGWLTTSARNGLAIYRTGDGGRVWSPIELPAPPSGGLSGHVVSARRPVFAGPSGVLDVTISTLNVVNGGRDVVSSPQVWIYHSNDGGLTWHDPIPMPAAGLPGSMPAHVGPAITWYASANGVWISADEGRTWRRRDAPPGRWGYLDLHPLGAGAGWCLAFPDRKDPQQAGFAPALFHTTDGGRSWSRIALPDPGAGS